MIAVISPYESSSFLLKHALSMAGHTIPKQPAVTGAETDRRTAPPRTALPTSRLQLFALVVYGANHIIIAIERSTCELLSPTNASSRTPLANAIASKGMQQNCGVIAWRGQRVFWNPFCTDTCNFPLSVQDNSLHGRHGALVTGIDATTRMRWFSHQHKHSNQSSWTF